MKITGYPALLAFCVAAPLSLAWAENEQMLESGGFEWPAVLGKKARSEGADISKSAATNAEWIKFQDKPDGEGGRLIFGLTSEMSHGGRQGMYVEFDKLTKPNVSADMVSDFLPIKPGKPYRVGIWGRMDKARPITLAQRLPILQLRVDWFKLDEEGDMAQVGQPVWKMQPIPGPKTRKPFFIAGDWREYFADLTSPEDAGFIKITWSWRTPPAEEGETDGVIYFDDATLVGEPGPKPPPEELEEYEEEKPAAEKPAAPGAPGTPAAKPEPSTPAAPEKPAEKPAGRKESKIDVTPVR